MSIQTRLRRTIVIDNLLLTNEVKDHTPPAITTRNKDSEGQAIIAEQMVGIEKLEAKFNLIGSIEEVRKAVGAGYAKLIDIVVTDTGLNGSNGKSYTHTYIYSTKVKGITPATGADGEEAIEVTLSPQTYTMKADGTTLDYVDVDTLALTIGGHVILEPVS
ncbi:phage major tail tube protein [Vibrio parahaemolyticus]|nr:hypothetical protein [Vibrio alginolyticus]